MNNSRQDAWSQDEDVLLAEIVLRYIREGKTQLEAFKEVGKRLSRTPAACGFRWNASIRKQYQKAIELAKKDRKQQTEPMIDKTYVEEDVREEGTLDAAISLLKQMKVSYSNDRDQVDQSQVQLLHDEIRELKQQLKRYEEAWKEMGQLWRWVDHEDERKSLTK
ncbi:RsfA family transcriptional regulator [Aquibacillus koreensis]|uniref:RsfA family transcriptional regulator n=1 Tax=Aquibacillus koreensis TaxID=279446 RepID=A0A9X4AIC6_9BACI|nr:RsfA family transcriptional regulator [Aquibacillus koreensis]MCT2538071.1 RsfA family transcriptional regulator [Aquibacillus koreensis]MDC3420594.1 RsfA family transcriptional regulator [Aquibacillus koreensis]